MTEGRFYRILVRVVAGPKDGHFDAVVPSYATEHTFRLPVEAVPEDLRGAIAPDGYLLAQMTLNAPPECVQFREWEHTP